MIDVEEIVKQDTAVIFGCFFMIAVGALLTAGAIWFITSKLLQLLSQMI